MNRLKIYRVIDANGNRVLEGLRVAEDVTRFILESTPHSKRFKILRHKIAHTIQKIDKSDGYLLISRNSEIDVGADRIARNGKSKNSYADLFRANCRRAEEALRVLEESCRLLKNPFRQEFATARFDLYTLEKETILAFPKSKWSSVDIYVIPDSSFTLGRRLDTVIKQSIAGGAKAIQLRESDMNIREKLKWGKIIRNITRKQGILFIINDRPDVAIALEADGLHIGQKDISLKIARNLLGNDIILGVSTHTMDQALTAESDGADYISVGPIFRTTTKKDAELPVGLKLLRKVRKKTTLPIVAIGGINKTNIKQVIEAGADSVAVISCVGLAQNIKKETQTLVNIIQRIKRKKIHLNQN